MRANSPTSGFAQSLSDRIIAAAENTEQDT